MRSLIDTQLRRADNADAGRGSWSLLRANKNALLDCLVVAVPASFLAEGCVLEVPIKKTLLPPAVPLRHSCFLLYSVTPDSVGDRIWILRLGHSDKVSYRYLFDIQ